MALPPRCDACDDRTPILRIHRPPPGDPLCRTCYGRLCLLERTLSTDA